MSETPHACGPNRYYAQVDAIRFLHRRWSRGILKNDGVYHHHPSNPQMDYRTNADGQVVWTAAGQAAANALDKLDITE